MENRCLLYCVKNDGFFVERIKAGKTDGFVTENKIRVPETDNPGIRPTEFLCCLRC